MLESSSWLLSATATAAAAAAFATAVGSVIMSAASIMEGNMLFGRAGLIFKDEIWNCSKLEAIFFVFVFVISGFSLVIAFAL